jgi:hypothetical protein
MIDEVEKWTKFFYVAADIRKIFGSTGKEFRPNPRPAGHFDRVARLALFASESLL